MSESKDRSSDTAPQKTTTEKKPSFYSPLTTIILTVLIFFGAQLFAGIILLFYPILAGWGDDRVQSLLNETTTQFLIGIVVHVLIMVLLWWVLKIKKKTFRSIGLWWPKLSDAGWAFAGFGVYVLLFIVLAVLASVLFPAIDFQQEQQIGFESVERNYQLALVFISLVILPPIVEEVLVRGFLYKGLRARLSIVPSALITSVIFAIAHLQFGTDAPLLWAAAIDTFALSLVLVYLVEKTGKLGAPILLHMLKNGIAFTLLFVIGIN